jgi:hypothetical protein
VGLTREEYRQRVAALRTLTQTFRGGRLEVGGSGGSQGMLFLRTRDGATWFIGGANDGAVAHALVEAVNFALDCCERPDTRE